MDKPSLYRSEARFTLSINRIIDWFIWIHLTEERKLEKEQMTLELDDPRIKREAQRFKDFMAQLGEEEK